MANERAHRGRGRAKYDGSCPTFKGHYCKRHGDAVHRIATAISAANDCLLYADAEGHSEGRYTLPSWIVPAATSRPDILAIPSLPRSAAATPVAPAARASHTVLLLEWFHTSDLNLHDRQRDKLAQHSALRQALQDQGWGIVIPFSLGCSHSGALPNNFFDFTDACRVPRRDAQRLAQDLGQSTISSNISIISQRAQARQQPPGPANATALTPAAALDAPPHLADPFSGPSSPLLPNSPPAAPPMVCPQRQGTTSASSPNHRPRTTGHRRPMASPPHGTPASQRRRCQDGRSSDPPDPG